MTTVCRILVTNTATSGRVSRGGTSLSIAIHMRHQKLTNTDSQHDRFIESLKDNRHAGEYITSILEEMEHDPELLRDTLSNVVDARSRDGRLSKLTRGYHRELDRMLVNTGGKEIYTFLGLLQSLGYTLTLAPTGNSSSEA